MDETYFLKTFATLFALMNPIASLPIFLSLTQDRTMPEKRQVAYTTTITLVAGCIVVYLFGENILTVFGIQLNHFRLAGGLLILLIALSMLQGQRSPTHRGNEKEKATFEQVENPGVYPLAIPLLLGPGTISTIIIFTNQVTDQAQEFALIASLSCMIAVLFATFMAAPLLSKVMGQTATSLISRLMGMILAAIAMGMITSALGQLLPGLTAPLPSNIPATE